MSTNDDHDTTQPGEPDAHADYLWDKSGPPDSEIVALESALASRRWSGRLPESVESQARPRGPRERGLRLLPRALAASLLAAAAVGIGISMWQGLQAPRARDATTQDALAGAPSPYSIESTGASYRIEDARPGDGALVPGSRLVTQADSVRLRVGPIGSVTVEPQTRIRIEDPAGASAGAGEYLLWLERGTISATIFAAPRLFQLGTPSGIAVDMGCAYTASVDEAGVTRLAVTTGQVSFETPQRKVLVPAGASARAWPGRGPGTPVWDDAPPEYREAVERLDEASASGGGGPDATAALASVLATERSEDSLSLWHLLDDDLDGALRAQVYTRLATLAPPPDGVTREGCLARDRGALDTWRDALGWAWPASGSFKSSWEKQQPKDGR
jgi:hypothetical protein